MERTENVLRHIHHGRVLAAQVADRVVVVAIESLQRIQRTDELVAGKDAAL